MDRELAAALALAEREAALSIGARVAAEVAEAGALSPQAGRIPGRRDVCVALAQQIGDDGRGLVVGMSPRHPLAKGFAFVFVRFLLCVLCV